MTAEEKFEMRNPSFSSGEKCPGVDEDWPEVDEAWPDVDEDCPDILMMPFPLLLLQLVQSSLMVALFWEFLWKWKIKLE